MDDAQTRITVLGSGSWGTALAKLMADQGYPIRLWARRAEHAQSIQQARENAQYLPGFKLPPTLQATSDLQEALHDAEMVISVVPSQSTRSVWTQGRAYIPAGVPIFCASKGIENESLQMMLTVLKETVPDQPTGFVGGPSFAKEVAAQLPTAIVVAAEDEALAKKAQTLMSCSWMRTYITHDVVGVEMGGALKNVIAIACGIADGLGLGHNTRAALITRGLAELTRAAVRQGADPLTLAGLAGMGDLVLTCTGDQSRNRRVGIGLGKGRSLQEILDEMGQVAEGVKTTLSAQQLAEKLGVDMPITHEMHRILYQQEPAQAAVKRLMMRTLKHEAQ